MMDASLFQSPDRLPHVPTKIAMFYSMPHRSLSSRDNAYQNALDKRCRQSSRLLRMKGEAQDEGERIVYRQDSQSLQIYRASDSLWWTDHRHANRDSVARRVKLPTESEAREIAQHELERLKLNTENAIVAGISYVEASIAREGARPQTYPTALDVNYSFTLADSPVFGPGAKIKVSLVEGGQVAQVVYFWRRPRRAAAMSAITPDEALETFQRDPAFFRLRHADAAIDIHSIRFGYYAMSPGDFQRLYVPVYAIDATVKTREFPQYDFRRYVVAVKIASDKAKTMDVIANPAACRMF